MLYKSLSVQNPDVLRLVTGDNPHLILSWLPDYRPLLNVLLVEHDIPLVDPLNQVPGCAVAVVDFVEFRAFLPADCSSVDEWTPGLFVWKIKNVRLVKMPFYCPAKQGIFYVRTSHRKLTGIL